MTDSLILELYWARSESAIEESQRSYGPYCYRIASAILNDPRDSEESVNDTWLGAWNAIPPARPLDLKAFFGALTRRISIGRLRERTAAKRGGGEALAAIDELAECIPARWSTEKAVEAKELVRALNAFLAAQPETERALFVARYWYGLPVARLAGKFGLRQNTVLTKLRRTRIRLREYLEKEELL